MRLHGSVGGQKGAFAHELLVLREPGVHPLDAAASRAFTAERKQLRGLRRPLIRREVALDLVDDHQVLVAPQFSYGLRDKLALGRSEPLERVPRLLVGVDFDQGKPASSALLRIRLAISSFRRVIFARALGVDPENVVEAGAQTMIGTVPPSALQAEPVT